MPRIEQPTKGTTQQTGTRSRCVTSPRASQPHSSSSDNMQREMTSDHPNNYPELSLTRPSELHILLRSPPGPAPSVSLRTRGSTAARPLPSVFFVGLIHGATVVSGRHVARLVVVFHGHIRSRDVPRRVTSTRRRPIAHVQPLRRASTSRERQ